jgi:hypothetical protein
MLLGYLFFSAITPKILSLSIGIFTFLFLIQRVVMSRIDLNEAKSFPWLGRLMGGISGFTYLLRI